MGAYSFSNYFLNLNCRHFLQTKIYLTDFFYKICEEYPPMLDMDLVEPMPRMTRFMKRGLLVWLPDEIFQLIFKYLPLKSIKRCRLVSRKWKSLIDSPSILRCVKVTIDPLWSLPIRHRQLAQISKILGSDLIRHVGKVVLRHYPKHTMELIEPIKKYLQTKGVEIDMAEVKKIVDQVGTLHHVLVISLLKTKHGTSVSKHVTYRKRVGMFLRTFKKLC